MPIITLTTDFGMKDHFAGALKGAIYKELSDVSIVDISHLISPFDITEAAYIIKNAYGSFPKNTVHLIDVDSELSPENKHVAFYLDDHYFVCPDNGLLSLIASDIKPKHIVELTLHKLLNIKSSTKNIFVKAACHLARGGHLDLLGNKMDDFKEINQIQPSINDAKNQIIGSVIYIDNYGNVVSNISKKLFQDIGKARPFEVQVRKFSFTQIFNQYNDIVNFNLSSDKRQDDGKRLLLFNNANYLEIALFRSNLKTVGGASTLLGLEIHEPITIRFN